MKFFSRLEIFFFSTEKLLRTFIIFGVEKTEAFFWLTNCVQILESNNTCNFCNCKVIKSSLLIRPIKQLRISNWYQYKAKIQGIFSIIFQQRKPPHIYLDENIFPGQFACQFFQMTDFYIS